LAKEHGYADLIAKRLNKKYVNLGLNGSGIDMLFQNLVLHLSRYPKPSKVFIQWPSFYREYVVPNNNIFLLNPTVAANASHEVQTIWKSLTLEKSMYYKSTLIRSVLLNLLKNMDIPVVELFLHYPTNELTELDFTEIKTQHLVLNDSIFFTDLARDLAHPGIQSNLAIANTVILELEK